MNVTVNNKPVETGASTLKELAVQLELPEKGVAVAVSNKMVPRSEWENSVKSSTEAAAILGTLP